MYNLLMPSLRSVGEECVQVMLCKMVFTLDKEHAFVWAIDLQLSYCCFAFCNLFAGMFDELCTHHKVAIILTVSSRSLVVLYATDVVRANVHSLKRMVRILYALWLLSHFCILINYICTCIFPLTLRIAHVQFSMHFILLQLATCFFAEPLYIEHVSSRKSAHVKACTHRINCLS